MLQNASLMHQFQDSVLDVGEIGKTQLSIYRVYVHDNKYHPLEYALINHDCFQGETECCLSQIEDALSFSVVSIEHTKAFVKLCSPFGLLICGFVNSDFEVPDSWIYPHVGSKVHLWVRGLMAS